MLYYAILYYAYTFHIAHTRSSLILHFILLL